MSKIIKSIIGTLITKIGLLKLDTISIVIKRGPFREKSVKRWLHTCVVVIIMNTSLAAKGPLAHRLQRCTACKIRRGASKLPTGSGKVSKQLSLNKFFDPNTPSMRKVDDGEKKEKR